MTSKMPVLFIGHGSPMNIILENDYTRSLAALAKKLPRPKLNHGNLAVVH